MMDFELNTLSNVKKSDIRVYCAERKMMKRRSRQDAGEK